MVSQLLGWEEWRSGGITVADIVNIEDEIEEGPAADIWSWGLVEGKERYLPHLRRRDRLYLVKHHQPVITLGPEIRRKTSENNHLLTSNQQNESQRIEGDNI